MGETASRGGMIYSATSAGAEGGYVAAGFVAEYERVLSVDGAITEGCVVAEV